MKSLAYIVTFLLSVGAIEVTTMAHPQVKTSTSESKQEVDRRSASEQVKIIEECEIPDSSKPLGETKLVPQLCGRALSLPKPAYPEEAKSKRVSGLVQVNVVSDEHGRVIWAKAVTGPEALQGVSIKAACRARYSPTLISGRAVKSETTIQYYFMLH